MTDEIRAVQVCRPRQQRTRNNEKMPQLKAFSIIYISRDGWHTGNDDLIMVKTRV